MDSKQRKPKKYSLFGKTQGNQCLREITLENGQHKTCLFHNIVLFHHTEPEVLTSQVCGDRRTDEHIQGLIIVQCNNNDQTFGVH